MIACVRGCTRPRHHATECPNTQGTENAACPGCEPREALFGAICTPDHYWLQNMLGQAPHAHTWLRGHLAPGMAQKTGDYQKRKKINASPAPLNVEVLDAVDDLNLSLTGWLEAFLDHTGLKGPQARDIASASRFLLTHLGSLECAPFVEDIYLELRRLLSNAHALAPWRAEVRGLHNVPCPECHCSALALHAPSYEGAELQVTCRECRLVIPEEEFRRYARLLKYLYEQENANHVLPSLRKVPA